MVETSSPAIQGCGCASPPKRVCDLCAAPFLACSLACLRRHQATAHGGGAAAESQPRSTDYHVQLNRNIDGHRERYGGHREHVMRLLATVGRAPSIGIFGAGNCTDLDTDHLAADFDEVHLIDVDGEALERGRESFPPDSRDRVVTHGGIDLSGFEDRIDEWGDRFPDNGELGRAAVASIHSILTQVGRTFHVVLSDCILSQLPIAYRRAWVTSRTNWNSLFTAITAVHLGTLVGSLEGGGRGAIACDALGSRTAPELRDLVGADPEVLQRFVKEGIERGTVSLDPDPGSLLKGLAVPGLRELVDSPQVTQPWLWNTGDMLLVYGLLFRRV
jgi:hypothetical protein